MVKNADLTVLIRPYLLIGLVIFALFLVIWFARMPANNDQSHEINFLPTLKRLLKLPGDTVCYPGHGMKTKIAWEQEANA